MILRHFEISPDRVQNPFVFALLQHQVFNPTQQSIWLPAEGRQKPGEVLNGLLQKLFTLIVLCYVKLYKL